MELNDCLTEQIDQLDYVLEKIFTELPGLKNSCCEEIELANTVFKEETAVLLKEIAEVPTDNFIETLTENKELSNEILEILASVLFLFAEDLNRQDFAQGKIKKELYKKCLKIYEYLKESCLTYYFDTYLKVEKIKAYLE